MRWSRHTSRCCRPSSGLGSVHPEAGALELGHVGVPSLRVGHQVGDRVELADAGEASTTDLGRVGDHDDPRRCAHQAAVGLGLDLVVGGEAGAGTHAVDADHGDIEVDVAQGQLGERTDQLVGLAAGTATAYDELDVGAYGELGGDVQR